MKFTSPPALPVVRSLGSLGRMILLVSRCRHLTEEDRVRRMGSTA